MKSIDNMQVLSLSRRMKFKNIKLNSDKIHTPINKNNRLLSPSVTDLQNHNKLLLNDNLDNSKKILSILFINFY